MARVPLTDSLKREIATNCSNGYRVRVAAAKNALQTRMAEDIYNVIVPPPLQEKLKEIPQNLLTTSDNIGFTYRGEGFSFKYSYRRPVPSPFIHTWSGGPPFKPAHADVERQLDEFLELKKEQEKQEEAVSLTASRLMEQCDTLKQLIEVWPSVVDFCPKDVIDRHNRAPAPRKERKQVAISAEDQLNLVKVRLSK